MKHLILAIIILIVPLSIGPIFAQAPAPTPEQQNVELMGEDDRLPFMQTEQAPRMAEPSSGGLLLKTIGAMLVIVGLIFAGAWLAKKFGLGNHAEIEGADDLGLAVMRSISLGTGKSLAAVRFGERTLLVGTTPQSITLIAEGIQRTPGAARQTRSVAEMLDAEMSPFETEFHAAEARISQEGGHLS